MVVFADGEKQDNKSVILVIICVKDSLGLICGHVYNDLKLSAVYTVLCILFEFNQLDDVRSGYE